MRRQILAITLLCAAAGARAGERCDALQPEAVMYREVAAALMKDLPRRPTRIEGCGGGYWKAYWDAFEVRKSWSKRAEGTCWGKPDGKRVLLWSCGVTVLVSNGGPHPIYLGHDLPLATIRQIVEFVGTRVTPPAHVETIDYLPVRDGGAWSVEDYGYELRIRSADIAGGDVLQVYRDCTPTPCVWAMRRTGNWAS